MRSFWKLAMLLLRLWNLKRAASRARSSVVVRPSEPWLAVVAETVFAAIVNKV